VKRGLFQRIFILYAVVLALTAFVTVVYIAATLRQSFIDDLKQSLSSQANLVMALAGSRAADLDGLCKELKKATGARVTLIAEDGRVLGDSDADPAGMENHLNRPEIEQASLSDTGASIHSSSTLKTDFLYLARRQPQGAALQGFVRLAVPLSDVYRAVNALRIGILLVVGLALAVPALIALWQTERLRRLFAEIRSFSRALAKGDVGRRLFLTGASEFSDLAADLNTMSSKLQAMMADNEEERKRLNVILTSVPDTLLISDAKGSIVLASTSSPELFGSAEITGKGFMEVIRDPVLAKLLDRVRETMSPGVADIRLEFPVERHLEAWVSPLSYGGKEFSGFVAVFHDVTRLRKLEEARKDFVANASHEIKTPVTAIRGFTETLLEGAVEDRETARRFLGMIKANSERINNLVDDLMTISQIELGVTAVEKTPVLIGDAVDAVLANLGPKAEAKGLTIETSFTDEPLYVMADRNRLIQILTNLLDNAIKFTEAGKVAIGVETEPGMLNVVVEDTGIGIARKHLARLGERFYRVDPARSRKMGGTGLGLAIVKHLVKAHNWTMHVESTPGRGTKVVIGVPADSSPE
jgi:two-component system phosphate regulon sensor histidine kinase PhoR